MTEYFKSILEQIQNNWNVESALDFFCEGKSNEGTEKSKSMSRYYVKPIDIRFRQIFLNFDSNRNIDSIVWFLDNKECELLTLSELKNLFGEFKSHNVTYDDTTELTFFQNKNKNIKYIKTSIFEWSEREKDGNLYFIKDNLKIKIDDDYKFSSISFKLNNST